MKISVKLEVSESKRNHTFNLDELDITREEWDLKNNQEKYEIIEKAVFDLPEQPYWMIETFRTI